MRDIIPHMHTIIDWVSNHITLAAITAVGVTVLSFWKKIMTRVEAWRGLRMGGEDYKRKMAEPKITSSEFWGIFLPLESGGAFMAAARPKNVNPYWTSKVRAEVGYQDLTGLNKSTWAPRPLWSTDDGRLCEESALIAERLILCAESSGEWWLPCACVDIENEPMKEIMPGSQGSPNGNSRIGLLILEKSDWLVTVTLKSTGFRAFRKKLYYRLQSDKKGRPILSPCSRWKGSFIRYKNKYFG